MKHPDVNPHQNPGVDDIHRTTPPPSAASQGGADPSQNTAPLPDQPLDDLDRREGPETPLPYMILKPLGVGLFVLAIILGLLQFEQTLWVWSTGVTGAILWIGSFILTPRREGAFERTFHWSTGYGINNWALILGVAGIVILLNGIASRHSRRWDFTMNQLYTLSDQTTKLLGKLSTEVKVTAFYPDAKGSSPEELQARRQREKVKEMLDDYQANAAKGKFSYTIADPFKDPAIVKKYSLEDWGIVVFEAGGRQVKIQRDQLFARQNPFSPQPAEFKGEEAFTGALLDLQSGKQQVVYFLEGHGERSTDDSQPTGMSGMKELMQRERYVLKSLNLAQVKDNQVPDDCSVLVVAGARKPFVPQEVDAIRKWMKGPGHGTLFLVDTSPVAGLVDLLADTGLEWKKNMVVEADPRRMFYGIGGSVVPSYMPHKITEELQKAKIGVVLFEVAYLLKAAKLPEGLEQQGLIQSTAQSWATSDFTKETVEYTEGVDTKGPLVLGYAMEWKPGKDAEKKTPTPEGASASDAESKARIVAIGDSDFASNQFVKYVGNGDLFMNSLGWLAFSSEKTATIRPKQEENARIDLTTHQEAVIFRSVILIEPFLVLLLGGAVWHWRRRL